MNTNSPGEEQIDWRMCTFEGSEREQLRVWSRLPLRRKLEALDEMCALARRTIANRRRLGLPYFDPYTGELIRPLAPATAPPVPTRPECSIARIGAEGL